MRGCRTGRKSRTRLDFSGESADVLEEQNRFQNKCLGWEGEEEDWSFVWNCQGATLKYTLKEISPDFIPSKPLFPFSPKDSYAGLNCFSMSSFARKTVVRLTVKYPVFFGLQRERTKKRI